MAFIDPLLLTESVFRALSQSSRSRRKWHSRLPNAKVLPANTRNPALLAHLAVGPLNQYILILGSSRERTIPAKAFIFTTITYRNSKYNTEVATRFDTLPGTAGIPCGKCGLNARDSGESAPEVTSTADLHLRGTVSDTAGYIAHSLR